MFKPIPKQIKEEILSKIKNEGLSVLLVLKQYQVSTKNIYGWLAKQMIESKVLIPRISKIKTRKQTVKRNNWFFGVKD